MASIAVKSGMIMRTHVVIWAGISAADKGRAVIGCIECVNVHLLYPPTPPHPFIQVIIPQGFGWLLGDLCALGV